MYQSLANREYVHFNQFSPINRRMKLWTLKKEYIEFDKYQGIAKENLNPLLYSNNCCKMDHVKEILWTTWNLWNLKPSRSHIDLQPLARHDIKFIWGRYEGLRQLTRRFTNKGFTGVSAMHVEMKYMKYIQTFAEHREHCRFSPTTSLLDVQLPRRTDLYHHFPGVGTILFHELKHCEE